MHNHKAKKALILAGIPWDTTIQRHHAIAERLAHNGYEVIFLEAVMSSSFSLQKFFSRIKSNLSNSEDGSMVNIPRNNISVVTSPFINPQGGIFRLYNKFALKKLLRDIPNEFDIIVNYLPISTTLDTINSLKYSTLIYDCVRDFRNWGGYPTDIDTLERKLMNISDEILVDSYYLFDRISGETVDKRVTQILPMLKRGQESVFASGKAPASIKRVTYLGHLGSHVDMDVIKSLINEGLTVNHFGSADRDIPDGIVKHGFIADPSELASRILEESDALIIPYKGNMDGVIPAKLFECLSSNLPVFVSSFYDSLKLSNLLYIYKGSEIIDVINTYTQSQHITRLKLIKQYLSRHNYANEIGKFDKLIGGDSDV